MNGRRLPGSDDELLETLRLAQRFGVLGAQPVETVVRRARAFTVALAAVRGRVVDLGSGGGVPGLVVAIDRPDLEMMLVDRREKRADLLERAVRRLGLGDRVTVRCEDAARLVGVDGEEPFDAATARGFGPPAHTLRIAAGCVTVGGCIVISEPPPEGGGGASERDSERWPPDLLDELGLTEESRGRVASFRRRACST